MPRDINRDLGIERDNLDSKGFFHGVKALS